MQTKNIEIKFESCFANSVSPELALDDMSLSDDTVLKIYFKNTNDLKQTLPENNKNISNLQASNSL